MSEKYMVVKYLAGGKELTKEELMEEGRVFHKLPFYESAVDTYSGKEVGLEASYDSKEEAIKAWEKISEFNPSGYYNIAIVELDE